MSFRMPYAQPILTLVYNKKCNSSNRALSILYDALKKHPGVFKLDILDYKKQPPTKDQLRNITEYLGVGKDFSTILRKDASADAETLNSVDELEEAIRRRPEILQRPILVDWDKGKAIVARPPEKVGDFLKEMGYWKEGEEEHI
ncbi:2577_t:CDS:1 [Acaulospora colombiana]|uniref:2577_t:CDS:1 n=1 Tax=Acaulospora colombiana TaxID=27376 RepID=A0ACA9LPP4_9GLOM|nr:2577_t:CDS:1 [Acaulospora colombiana]